MQGYVHMSVLLFDGKIINWKVGSYKWKDVPSAFSSRQPFWFIHEEDFRARLSVDSMTFKAESIERNNMVYREIAPEFFKMYEIHPKMIEEEMNLPY